MKSEGRLRQYWSLSSACLLALFLIGPAIMSRTPPIPPLFPATQPSVPVETIAAARKDVGEAISKAEEHLLTVLGLQLGIVAFAATMIFGKDFTTQAPKDLFGILVFLTVLLAVLCLHLYKSYLGFYAYAVQLESSIPEGLRSYQQIFQRLSERQAAPLVRPLISLTDTFYVVSFLPVYVVIVTAIGFGRKLGVRPTTMLTVSILMAGWAVAYLLPVFRMIVRVGG